MSRFDWLELGKGAAAPAAAELPREAPHDGPSFYRAARQLREAAFFNTASQYYERAIGFNDHDFAAWSELIDALIRAKRVVDADKKSYEALNNYRQVRAFYASRALALAYRGMLVDAYTLSDVSLEGEKNWYACCVRAELLLKDSLDNRVLAAQFLEQALEATSSLWEPSYLGGTILFNAGWPQLAAGYFSEAAHYNPRAVAGWIGLGDCFKALRLHDQAQFYYQKAIEISPTHELVLARMRENAGGVFGLLRVFQRDVLRKRWNRAFEEFNIKREPTLDDF
jgi:tetratricopeptide (TPR) repeat protein